MNYNQELKELKIKFNAKIGIWANKILAEREGSHEYKKLYLRSLHTHTN